MRVHEAETTEHGFGVQVLRVVSGRERFCTKLIEGMLDDGTGGFFAETFAPKTAADVYADFMHVGLVVEGPKTGTAYKISLVSKKDGPILKTKLPLPVHLQLQSCIYGFHGHDPAKIPCHVRVGPKGVCQDAIRLGPGTESQAG